MAPSWQLEPSNSSSPGLAAAAAAAIGLSALACVIHYEQADEVHAV